MKFYARYGNCETTIPWNRPTAESVRTWRDSLSFDLTDWYIVGNFIEEFSPTFDLDCIFIQKPLQVPLNELSDMFTSMITIGFDNKLLVDPCFMPQFYQDEWEPITKIRPDNQFYKEHRGRIYNPIYKADEVEQLHPQLWQYKYTKPHDNWQKGKDRGYSFQGIPLSEY